MKSRVSSEEIERMARLMIERANYLESAVAEKKAVAITVDSMRACAVLLHRLSPEDLEWAVGRWNAEVKYRPLVNVHRRALDDTWRQVIRYFGGDDRELLGPPHDELV